MGIVKSNLINQLSDNYSNFLKKDINKVVEIFLEEIKRAVKSKRRVELRNFAVWYSKKQKKKFLGILKLDRLLKCQKKYQFISK